MAEKLRDYHVVYTTPDEQGHEILLELPIDYEEARKIATQYLENKVKTSFLLNYVGEAYGDEGDNDSNALSYDAITSDIEDALNKRHEKKRTIYIIELLCSPTQRDAIIGDLLEAFEDIKKKHGEKRAETWWRFQVFWTCTSLLWSRLSALPGIALIGVGLSWIGKQLSGG
jgi:hypothetical protein